MDLINGSTRIDNEMMPTNKATGSSQMDVDLSSSSYVNMETLHPNVDVVPLDPNKSTSDVNAIEMESPQINNSRNIRVYPKRSQKRQQCFVKPAQRKKKNSRLAKNNAFENSTSSVSSISSLDVSNVHNNISVASNGSLPEYKSSPESNQPKVKRSKLEKNWKKIQDFLNADDAEKFIKDECIWSIYTSKQTLSGLKSTKVSMYKSENDHSCGDNSSKSAPMTSDVKKIIENHFKNGIKGRKPIQTQLTSQQIPLPSKNQINNFLAELRKKLYGPTKMSLGELEKFCIEHSPIPEDPDQPYIAKYSIDYEGEGNFHCFISTRNLLKNAVNAEVVSADSTYKMLWEGFPLSPIGTIDQDRHFHLYGTLFSKDETNVDYEFAFRCIKTAVSELFDYEMKPTVLISDAAGAIHIAAKAVFGPDILIRMCWFHMKKALKKNLSRFIKEQLTHKAILCDVDTLQLSQSPEIFTKASNLFLKKYAKHKEFCDYFQQTWLNQNRNWYEGCTPITSPSTNNAMESWNGKIKKEKSFRNRFPLNQFLNVFFTWTLQWSQEYTSGAKIFIHISTITLDLKTKAYQWSRLNKPLKSLTNENGSKFYMIPAGAELNIKNWNILYTWTTFDQFKSRAFLGWKTIWDDQNWRNSQCNCPAFMKLNLCKHVVGIAIRKNLYEVPTEAKNVPIGTKRKRGRPQKSKKALLIQ